MAEKPKSINALMSYLRNEKHISISGSRQKRDLRNIGYFHGYKGYRFFCRVSIPFPYTNFDELKAIYDFDMQVKSIVYSPIMFLETSLKNYALEVIIKLADNENFNYVFQNILNGYNSYRSGSKRYKHSMKDRLRLRNSIYADISYAYGNNRIVPHYYENNEPVPIWAIFELISLGEFGKLVSCMNSNARRELANSLGLLTSFDTDYRFVEKIIYLLVDIRNSVAHNNVVFDARFKSHSVQQNLIKYLIVETGVSGITFNTIDDYVVLIAFLMKKCGCKKKDVKQFLKQFSNSCLELNEKIPYTMYSMIIPSDLKSKLSTLVSHL